MPPTSCQDATMSRIVTSREFAARLQLALPLVQAPLAGFQGGALAAAAAAAGALGSLPGAALSPQALREEVTRLRAAGDRALNVNFFAHHVPEPDAAREAAWREALAPYYAEFGIDPAAVPDGPGRLPFGEEALAAVETLRPAIVSFHFGLPAPELVERVRATGAQVWSTATTVPEARWLEARGVDAVIAQGLEAGGHRGQFLGDDPSRQLGTMALLPQVAAAVEVPVIAAGGIADAAGVAAALRLGAAAVQLGTVLLLCPEATTSAPHRAALQSEAAQHTALTNLFSGRPARGIVNRLMRELGPMSALPSPFPRAANAIAPLRAAAEKAGSGDFSPLWAGQNVTGCRPVPAKQLLEELAAAL